MFYFTCNHGVKRKQCIFHDGQSTKAKTFLQCFILHVTTAYPQAVFDPAKNVLQYFCNNLV